MKKVLYPIIALLAFVLVVAQDAAKVRVNINTASNEELLTIPSLQPSATLTNKFYTKTEF
jgi:DNA uptake protein ComE-like DNA-binding protein